MTITSTTPTIAKKPRRPNPRVPPPSRPPMMSRRRPTVSSAVAPVGGAVSCSALSPRCRCSAPSPTAFGARDRPPKRNAGRSSKSSASPAMRRPSFRRPSRIHRAGSCDSAWSATAVAGRRMCVAPASRRPNGPIVRPGRRRAIDATRRLKRGWRNTICTSSSPRCVTFSMSTPSAASTPRPTPPDRAAASRSPRPATGPTKSCSIQATST